MVILLIGFVILSVIKLLMVKIIRDFVLQIVRLIALMLKIKIIYV